MNKFKIVALLIFLSIISILMQTTVFSPTWNTHLYIDLNLVLIICLGMAKNIPAAFPIVIFNGLLTDVMAGNMLGVHTLSRLISYLLIKGSAGKVNYESYTLRFLTLFIGTIVTWLTATILAKVELSHAYKIEPKIMINQATINTVVGLLISYPFFKTTHATIQK